MKDEVTTQILDGNLVQLPDRVKAVNIIILSNEAQQYLNQECKFSDISNIVKLYDLLS
jgi:hypothetical protein